MEEQRKNQLWERVTDLFLLGLTVAAIALSVFLAPQGDLVTIGVFVLGITIGLAIAWRR